MKALTLLLTLAVSSGCVVNRELVLPPPSMALDAPDVTALWNVSEVFVRANTAGSQNAENRDFAKLKTQLELRLRETLEKQASLGHRLDDAQFGLELVIDVNERSAVSPWFGLGIGLETATLLGGAGIGVLLGGAAAGPLGILIAAPFAVTAALIPPNSREMGQFELALVVRRTADGAVVASRHVHNEWHADLNGFWREEKLALESGAAVSELERALLELVRDVMREQSKGVLIAAPG
jgi:hypothetical protein